MPENGSFSCVAFCFRSLGPFERCSRATFIGASLQTKANFYRDHFSQGAPIRPGEIPKENQYTISESSIYLVMAMPAKKVEISYGNWFQF